MLLSVIICTRNRADEVTACLHGLAAQSRDFGDVEVIVVDNGSTDDTRAVVEELGRRLGYEFGYVYEAEPGLCGARNRGRASARGEILAYLDDDVLLGEGWVERVREHFLAGRSDCLGGKVTAELEAELPFAMDDSMRWFFQATNLGEKARRLEFPEHPIGCNMAFRAVVFDAVGGFDVNLKLYGDETDFFRRASEAGFLIWYDPAASLSQKIPAERLTVEELKSKSYKWGQGAATVWMLASGGAGRLPKISEYVLRTAYVRAGSVIRSSFGRFYTYWYNRGYLAQLIKGLAEK